jgi:hypothetical protein
MTAQDDITSVREKLGESIPTGGDESDTMFTDEQVTNWIDSNTSLDGAAYQGWQAKMANLANLVNVTDGAASRALGDAFDHAKDMVKFYGGLAVGPTFDRARIGKIVRS